MSSAKTFELRIFNIKDQNEFNAIALDLFQFHYTNNKIYRRFVSGIQISPDSVDSVDKIPFLPIDFFKQHIIKASELKTERIFESSGTSGVDTSRHHVTNLALYEKSLLHGFEHFFGKPEEYCFLALLPSYLERNNSSLVFMVNELMKKSKHPKNGFYLDEFQKLSETISELEQKKQKTILIGVSFALLDFAEQFPMQMRNTIVMETGGMKGKRKEMIREELHSTLKTAFNLDKINSEYGMTELLSQAYSKGEGRFQCPPWMRVYIRDTHDPAVEMQKNKTGGINIIDLANIYSCPFIATSDLGKMSDDGSFEVLGRFDFSEMRGCNLMVH